MLAEVPVVVSDIGGLDEIVSYGVDGLKSYAGNANSIADSILTLLYNPQLRDTVIKNAKQKVKNEYNWTKIAQDTHFIYQEAICQTMAERQTNQLLQERANRQKNKATSITNLLDFKKRHAYA